MERKPGTAILLSSSILCLTSESREIAEAGKEKEKWGQRAKGHSEADEKSSPPFKDLVQGIEINTGPTDCAYKLLVLGIRY